MRQLVRNLVSRTLPAAMALLSFAVPAWATTYYVSPTGDGTDPTAGFATGFSTIDGAIGDARVVAGDTVMLDKTTFVLANNVSVSKAITLCGAGENWETVLDGNKAKNMSSVSGATLHSFTLTNMGGQWAGTAGLDATGTIVSNLVFRQIGNLWTGNAGTRFPLAASGGLVTHCWITNNVMPNNAGVKLAYSKTDGSAIMENCYIADNVDRGCSGTESYRGIVVMDSVDAILRNCTIVNNQSDYCAVYSRVNSPKVYNNIIWGNASGSGDGTFRLKDGITQVANFKNNCMTTVTGLPDSNFADDPLFQPDDLHLMSTSPCRGKADKTLSPPAFDIEGDPRGETPSVGCVEYKKGSGFTCLISPSTEYVEEPNEIVLSVTLDGSYAEPLAYAWDFDGDGTVDSTAAQPSLSQVGKYQVSVAVTDNAGKKASASYKNTLVVAPAGGFVVYVSPTGDGTAPYAGFATGFSSIQAAIDFSAAGETVLLDKTTFELTESLTIDKRIVFRGAGENWETVLDGKATHTILVKATGALVHNFTFTNCGARFNDGMGLTINNASVVSNVVSRQNGNAHTAGNSGARFVWTVEAGLVTHCWCTNNSAPGNAGFRILGGTVENCYIADNIDRGLTSSYEARSGIVAIESGILRNCTIVDNQSAYAGLYYRGENAKVYNNLIWGNTLVNSSEINNWMLKGAPSTAN